MTPWIVEPCGPLVAIDVSGGRATAFVGRATVSLAFVTATAFIEMTSELMITPCSVAVFLGGGGERAR
jgi:hypothetical protein